VVLNGVHRQQRLPLQDSVLRHMPGKFVSHGNVAESEMLFREAVRLRQIKGCTYCSTAPATTGDLCAACDRRFQSGTFLQELDGHGKVFERGSSKDVESSLVNQCSV